MGIHKLVFAALLLPALAFGQDAFETRTLERMIVTHCKSDTTAPAVVVLDAPQEVWQEGEEEPLVIESGVEVMGDPIPADTACVTLDSHIHNVWIGGDLATYGQPIDQMIFSAVINSGERAYRIADWARTIDYTANGAQYMMSSSLQLDDSGHSLVYPIEFLRRAPKDAGYDPATIMRIERVTEDGVLLFYLDYRSASPEETVARR